MELSYEIQAELDTRLTLLEEGKTEFYSLVEVKKHICKARE